MAKRNYKEKNTESISLNKDVESFHKNKIIYKYKEHKQKYFEQNGIKKNYDKINKLITDITFKQNSSIDLSKYKNENLFINKCMKCNKYHKNKMSRKIGSFQFNTKFMKHIYNIKEKKNVFKNILFTKKIKTEEPENNLELENESDNFNIYKKDISNNKINANEIGKNSINLIKKIKTSEKNNINKNRSFNNIKTTSIKKIKNNFLIRNYIGYTNSKIKFAMKYIILLNLIFQLFSIKSKLFNKYEIKLKVKGFGLKKILGDDGRNCVYPCPSNTYINGNKKTFDDCHMIKIEENEENCEIKLEWTDTIITHTEYMFCECSEITEIDMRDFDFSQVTDTYVMFEGCKSLVSLDISNLKSQRLYRMKYMFKECILLTSLDLSNFDLSKIEDMTSLFEECRSLEYINLGCFDEKPGVVTENMFKGIVSNAIIRLDKIRAPNIYDAISRFTCISCSCEKDWESLRKKEDYDTHECLDSCTFSEKKYEYQYYCMRECLSYMHALNYKCYVLKYDCNTKCKTCINTGDDDIDSKELCVQCNDNYYEMIDDDTNFETLINCYKNPDKYYLDQNELKYKRCYHACKTCSQGKIGDKHNCLICDTDYELAIPYEGNYNCYPKCNNYYYFDNGQFQCLNNKICPLYYDKLIPEKGQCINDCSKDPIFNKEFRKKCYKNCPSDISYQSQENTNFCEVKCSKENPLEIKSTQECTNFCGINAMDNGSCISKYHDEGTNEDLILNNILKDITTIDFNRNSLNNNQNIKIEESYVNFIITSTKIQKINSYPLVNLGDCENILNLFYQNNNNDIILFVININKNGINKIAYEAYSEISGNNQLTKLDLNQCNNIINLKNELTKCSTYSIESIEQDSCLSCAESYYPIYGHINIFKCYQNLHGYYLDNYQYFKQCFDSCESCERGGNEAIHNCTECNKIYFYELPIPPYLNCYKECIYYFYYNINNEKYYCTQGPFCIDIFNKLIPEKNQCIDHCYSDSYYQFEFRKTCYKECPKNISIISENKEFFCEVVCTKDKPFEIVSTQECTDFCSIMQIKNKSCIINYKNNYNEDIESQEKLIENIQKELSTNFDTSSIDSGEDIIIELDDINVIITSTENQKNINISNNSNINLGLCEDKIKEENKIEKDKSLYILKIEVKQKEYKIPKTEYEIYYPLYNKFRLNKMNLAICKNIKIDLFIPVIINETLEKINPKSDYYNDICYTITTKNNTDFPLYQRKKEFINNRRTLCEENCDFKDYYNSIRKVACSCNVKEVFNKNISENIIDVNKLWKSFIDKKYIEKLIILKCYRLIFSLKNYFQNYGNLILLFVILLYIICSIIFFCRDYKIIKDYICIIKYFKIDHINIHNIVKKVIKEEKEKYSKNFRIDNNITQNKIKTKKFVPSLFMRIFNKKSEIRNRKKTYVKKSLKKYNNNIFYNHFNNININNNNSKLRLNSKSSRNQKTNINKKYYLEINYQNKKIHKLNEKKIYEYYKKIYHKTPAEINELAYNEALKYDKRSFCVYYYSLLITKHLFFFSFISNFDYNSRTLKIYLFFFNFTTYFIVNSFFFNEESINKIYEEGGNFDFIYNIPQILYSTIISIFLNTIIRILALTEKNFRKLRYKTTKNNIISEVRNLKRKLKIKFSFFFIYNIIILFFYWIYLGCFCAVYKHTQIHVIKDTIISYGTSLITPFGIYLLPSIFRILALKGKNRKILFGISKILQLL